MIQLEESLHGTIEQAQNPARIHRGSGATQHGIARDCDPRFQGQRGVFRSSEQRRLTGRAEDDAASQAIL
jgi:hypothetical protein